jgi:hypothetical protein
MYGNNKENGVLSCTRIDMHLTSMKMRKLSIAEARLSVE